MSFHKTGAALILIITAIVAGCSNREKINNEINYNDLYFDFTISGEEGTEQANCVFQFKHGGDGGKAVNIEPCTVELDGQSLETDSAKFSGFYYEVQKPLESFAGKHTIVFKTPGNKKYTNEFTFSPFTFEKELPEKVKRKPFTIRLNNFPANEHRVRLLLLDTAFESSGFNDFVPVVKGTVSIDEPILRSVKKGPVVLEFYLEQEIPLRQRTPVGGKISITYGLKKEFELTD
jgi:hypothetical protein